MGSTPCLEELATLFEAKASVKDVVFNEFLSCSRLADDLTVAVTGSPGATAAHEAGHLIY